MQEIEELHVEEEDIRELVDELVRGGAPQTLDILADWYIGIVIRRRLGREA